MTRKLQVNVHNASELPGDGVLSIDGIKYEYVKMANAKTAIYASVQPQQRKGRKNRRNSRNNRNNGKQQQAQKARKQERRQARKAKLQRANATFHHYTLKAVGCVAVIAFGLLQIAGG